MIVNRIISRKPDIVMANPKIIYHRIDANPFRPEYIDSDTQLDKYANKYGEVRKLGNLLLKGIMGLSGGATPLGANYQQSGIRFIRTGEVNDCWIDGTANVFISKDDYDAIKRSRLAAGDLLLTITGSCFGKSAVVSKDLLPANISQHLVRLRLVKSLNPYFLVAYLNCYVGQLQIFKQTVGSTRQAIDYIGIREICLPTPDQRIQDYIGAKVELAEQCRIEANIIRDKANENLSLLWGWKQIENKIKAKASNKAYLVQTSFFNDRLDSEFYQPKFIELDSWLSDHDCWVLGVLVTFPLKGVQPSYHSSGNIPALTVTHIDPFSLNRSGANGFVTEEWLNLNPRANVEFGELLITVTGPPLGETVVVENFHLPSAINSHIARIRPKQNFNYPYFIAVILNSPLGRLQTTRFCKGIRQKELYPEDLFRFCFPKITREQVAKIDKSLKQSCLLIEYARSLIEEAKSDVESLIEGTLDTGAILSGKLKAPTWGDIEKKLKEVIP